MIDWITVFDVIAVLVAAVVTYKTGKTEAFLLLVFFTTSAYLSFFMFSTDAYLMWPMVFAVLITIFGLLSYNHIVVLGYVAQLAIVGLNQLFDVTGYSLLIYVIFGLQLLAVSYGHTFDYYRDMLTHSSSGKNWTPG